MTNRVDRDISKFWLEYYILVDNEWGPCPLPWEVKVLKHKESSQNDTSVAALASGPLCGFKIYPCILVLLF